MTKSEIRTAFINQVGIEEIFDIYGDCYTVDWTVETEQCTFVYDMKREKFVNITGY